MFQALDYFSGSDSGAIPMPALCLVPSRCGARSSLISPSAPPGCPEGRRGGGEDGISQRGGSGFPAILSVYGEKGEMEKAGRRRLVSAAPPFDRLRRRESGADEGGPGSLVRSGRDDAPRSGACRPGSSLCHCWTLGPMRAGLGRASRPLHAELLGDRSCTACGASGGRR